MNRREFAGSAAALAIAGCVSTPLADLSQTEANDAFLYAFAPFEMARVARRSTAGPIGFNRFGHRATLADHAARTVTTPNNDTLYSSAWVDLTGGPVEMFVPDIPDRYFSVACLSAFTDNFHIIGTRTTGGRGGRYWIVGPGWRGRAPEGVELIRAPTADIWVLARILVDGPEDLATAAAVQRLFTMAPVTDAALIPRRIAPTSVNDARNVLAVVNETLWRSRGADGQVARAQQFRAAGVGAFAEDRWDALSDTHHGLWNGVAAKAYGLLKTGQGMRGREVSGWRYPAAHTGDFGDDDMYRAQIALSGLGALPPAEAMYLSASHDAENRALNGAFAYRFSLPPGGAPVDAFWSLSMYETDAEGRLFFIDNPIGRYAIGNRTKGLVVAPDGSLTITLSHERPADAASWLPAPRNLFSVNFRVYLPRPALLSGAWTLPAITRI
jgi:hypothetical protein